MSLKSILNKLRRCLLVLLLFLGYLPLSGQTNPLKIKAAGKPLNEVLIALRDDYGIRFSFDHQLLSSYKITADTVFYQTDDALSYLIKGLPLEFKKTLQTYVLYPVIVPEPTRVYQLSARISDKDTRETLPYTHIRYENQMVISDQNGNFSLYSTSGNQFHLIISYLGYEVSDTLMTAGVNQSVKLSPAQYGIQKVEIKGKPAQIAASITSHPGEVRLNPRISNFLPGNGDHSLFNLLRLQPGILATGEQSNDLIIWGCYEGQSQVLFDGFTLYGLKNFNDQISVVNPLLIKDIKVLKGGFEPRYGNRVGGIVDITGYDGNTDRIHGNLIVNNMTVNGMLSVPVTSQSALVVAFRNTYYNLYNSSKLHLPARSGVLKENPVDLVVEPDYSFRDINLKYSGTSKRGDQYSFHLLYGTDTFSYHINVPRENFQILDTLQERNRQLGAAGNYQFRWKSGQLTTITASYSASRSNSSNQLDVQRNNHTRLIRNTNSANQIGDFSFKLGNRLMPVGKHTLEYGTGVNILAVGLSETSLGTRTTQKSPSGLLANAYIQDRFSLSRHLFLQYGIRADFPFYAPRVYAQPRASLEWEASSIFKIKTSIGRYNQFIVKSTQEDDFGNLVYYWALPDNKEIPVVSSNHFSMGGYFDWENFQIHAEAWYKTYSGLTRYKVGAFGKDPEILTGQGRGAGIDLYIQKQVGRISGWITYSLGKTLEHFPNFPAGRYLRAPQDQTHEIKFAALLDFSPVFFSVNYVYGSGLPNRTQALSNPELIDYPYRRFDASLTGRFNIKKTSLEAGLSVLNVFNRQNIKVSNFVRIPLTSLSAFNIQAEAIPITPTLFLKFSF